MNHASLEESFFHTSYIVRAPDKVLRLRIGRHDPGLDMLLGRYGATTWAFITAWNPLPCRLSAGENRERNGRLEEELLRMGFEGIPGEGAADAGDWEPEESFFIPGIGAGAALELARRFGQVAIVAGERGGAPELLWC